MKGGVECAYGEYRPNQTVYLFKSAQWAYNVETTSVNVD